jgi:hypothetical protein
MYATVYATVETEVSQSGAGTATTLQNKSSGSPKEIIGSERNDV